MSNNDGTGARPDDEVPHEASGERSAEPKDDKRKRGRPTEGKPILLRMSDEERMVADLLGDGVAARGVRIALRAVASMTPEAVRALASSKPASTGSSPPAPNSSISTLVRMQQGAPE